MLLLVRSWLDALDRTDVRLMIAAGLPGNAAKSAETHY
jgi:hypothetical protein